MPDVRNVCCIMTDPSPRQIALFGGSFNPPHVCHTLTTLWALQTQAIDEVWWIPTFQHAFDKELVDFDQRMAMCELALSEISRVRVDDIERNLGGESRTIDTVKALEERNPNSQFWLLIGADILGEVHRWKNWEGLMERVGLIVVGRQGYERDDLNSYVATSTNVEDSLDLNLPDISSSRIRDSLNQSDYQAVRPWIPRSVLDYISAHQLYRGS